MSPWTTAATSRTYSAPAPAHNLNLDVGIHRGHPVAVKFGSHSVGGRADGPQPLGPARPPSPPSLGRDRAAMRP